MKSLYTFNKKYNSSISESKIIDLKGNKILDEGFKDLSTIKLNILILYLNFNGIKDISALNSINFKSLQILNLSNNEIIDLKSLNNSKLDFLVELNLSCNKIDDITPLEKCKIRKIEKFNLNNNKISNIDAL